MYNNITVLDTVGRTSIWYTADFGGYPTYKAWRSLSFLS